MTDDERRELLLVYWELALAWKLYDTAVREQRLEDATYYAKQRESAEIRARKLLHFQQNNDKQ